MTVLLSIKPRFAHSIFQGVKRFEYRRSIFRRPVDRVVVYASAPVRKVIGEFVVQDILFDDLAKLWNDTKESAGITEDTFYEYFAGQEKGHAIRIGRAVMYETPLTLEDSYRVPPPQSFMYVTDATCGGRAELVTDRMDEPASAS
jgi:predicted transcriptional regulator